MTAAPDRDAVLDMLATYGDRRPQDVAESIDSLELAWLVHKLEQHYGTALDLDDAALTRMSTVSGTVEVLRELKVGSAQR